ncbi:MAG: VanZ family protein [Candidatus Pacearchaeota archaeon]
MIKQAISWFENHKKLSLIITLLIAFFIFYISSLSFETGSPGPEFKLKPALYHFCIFLLFSFFLLMTSMKKEKIDIFLLIILFSIVYAISDEFHQLFVVGRTCSLSDVLIDSIGILLAGLIYLLQSKYLS